MAKQKTEKVKLSTLERAIVSRDRHLKRMEKHIVTIQKYADEEIAGIRKKMAQVKVLRDALVNGQLKA